MKVVIIDYGAGNIFSVQQAFGRLGVETVLTSDANEIRSATHVVFPGVGHAEPAMEQLKITGLDQVIPTLTQPVLGICLGMQLMCSYSEEGDVEGLGIFDTRVTHLNSRILKFENFEIHYFDKYRRTQKNTGVQSNFPILQVPHMGWNDVEINEKSTPFYFVHSYAAEICMYTWGITEYPTPFSAALKKDNFWGVQFHPEKSGVAGEELLKAFLGRCSFGNNVKK